MRTALQKLGEIVTSSSREPVMCAGPSTLPGPRLTKASRTTGRAPSSRVTKRAPPCLLKALEDERTCWRRVYVPKETIAKLHVRAQAKNEACGDILAHPEVRHNNLVAQGGAYALDNLQLLCHMCHAQISEE